MSQNQGEGVDRVYSASEDLSAKQFYFMKAGTALHSVLLNDSAGGKCVGVLQDGNVDASSNAKHVNVRVSGEALVVAGGAITKDDPIQSDGSGKAATATTADQVLGIAREAATTDGDLILVELDLQGIF